MRNVLVIFLLTLICICSTAQTTRDAIHLVPNGKGWGIELPKSASNPSSKTASSNGISYHGGPVMRANSVNVYFIWYGNWTNGPKPSDSQTTVNLLNTLFGWTRGIGGSGYFKIDTTYNDTAGKPSGNIALMASTTNNYSRGKQLKDSDVWTVVNTAITTGSLPKDVNGLYFVLTSSDVAETSGFCSKYCGWHSRGSIGAADIKFAFVGNSDRCSASCSAQTVSPNGDSGADGMASIMAHEAEETVSDPDLSAWYDSSGNENADKCAWKFGPLTGVLGQGAYNQTFGTYNWLIQLNWENTRGGGCVKTLGGKFYTQ